MTATKREAPIQFRDADLAAKVNERGDPNEIAARDLARYYRMVESETAGVRARFSAAEWSLLRDVLNGSLVGDGYPRHLWMSVQDAIDLDATDRRWEVDGAGLVVKLRTLSHGECLALIDAVERWWNNNDKEA